MRPSVHQRPWRLSCGRDKRAAVPISHFLLTLQKVTRETARRQAAARSLLTAQPDGMSRPRKAQRGFFTIVLAASVCSWRCSAVGHPATLSRRAFGVERLVRSSPHQLDKPKPLAQVARHWRHPEHVKVFVQDVPDKYLAGAGGSRPGEAAHRAYSFLSLGPQLSTELELWNTHWCVLGLQQHPNRYFVTASRHFMPTNVC